MPRNVRATLSVLVALGLTGCQSRSPPLARSSPNCELVDKGFGPNGTVPIKTETVVTGLSVPWGIAFLPGGDWLITERPGRVRLVQKGALVNEPVATVAIAEGAEGGLLGIAIHPDFAANRLFYVYATVDNRGQPVNRVIRYKLSEDHRAAAIDKVVLDGIAAAQYHDGGRLRFGPDGMLYIGTGDSRAPALSQSLESLNGKLLRVTPDGEIPADNPFSGSPVFLLGIRNTEGFDWLDRATVVVTDHGPSGDTGRTGHDEVTVAHAGENLGWPGIYGCETEERKVPPALTWTEAVPPGGAAIYTGAAIPEWKGSLLIGTLRSKHLHRVAFDPANPRRVARHEVYLQGEPPAGFGRLREVVMGPDGALYVTTSNCDGRGDCPADKDRVLRITR
jgi:aldose sugar dehydrogenase